jgi:quercetin dioxygenase-like cupin family protein
MDRLEVKRAQAAQVTSEYGCEFRRILPWRNPGPSPEGMALGVVPPGGTTAPHEHEEFEHFLMLEGSAIVWVDGQGTECAVGDVVRVAPNTVHAIQNGSAHAPLKFLSLWSLETYAKEG